MNCGLRTLGCYYHLEAANYTRIYALLAGYNSVPLLPQYTFVKTQHSVCYRPLQACKTVDIIKIEQKGYTYMPRLICMFYRETLLVYLWIRLEPMSLRISY